MGAELIACDGLPIDAYIETFISPYTDRRAIRAAARRRAAFTTSRWSGIPMPVAGRYSNCVFRIDGADRCFRIEWHDSDEGLMAFFPRERPALSIQFLHPDVAWVQANDFSAPLPSGRLRELSAMLARWQGRFVVFDLRGNGGGDSFIGTTLLDALFRGTRLPPDATARWRTSELAERMLAGHLQRTRDAGASSPFLEALARAAQEARASGMPWFDTPDVDDNHEWIGADGPPFAGTLLLLTDAACTSACLDAADMALAWPRTLHIGEETDADTPYMDIGRAELPGGLEVSIPLKVWTGRARGANVPHRPTLEFPGAMNDDAAVRRWVLEEVVPALLDKKEAE